MSQYTKLASALVILALLVVVLAIQKSPMPVTKEAVLVPIEVKMPEEVKKPVVKDFVAPVSTDVNHSEIPVAPEEKTIPLVPKVLSFTVNRYIVPVNQPMYFVPIRKEDIRSFSGSFGPYPQSVRKYVEVMLCASEIDGSGIRCAQSVPDYRGDMMEFMEGYNTDEYIAGVARKQFLAWYELHTSEGMIAKSNVARVEIS